MSDLQTFDTCYFGSTQAAAMLGRLHIVNVDGGQPDGPGSGESILDIQDVSAFAPGANIDVYQAPNNTFGRVRRVREDRQRQRRPDRDEELGPVRAGGAARLAGHPAGREPHLPAGGRPGADGLLGCGRRGQQRLQRLPRRPRRSVRCCPSTTRPVSRTSWRPAGPRSTTPPSPRPSRSGTTAPSGRWRRRHLRGLADADLAARPPGPGRNDRAVLEQRERLQRGRRAPGNAAACDGQHCRPGRGGCRQLPDVSAAADEFTGGITVFSAVAAGGWNTFGGTSWRPRCGRPCSPRSVNASSTCRTTRRRRTAWAFSTRSSTPWPRIRRLMRRPSTTSRPGTTVSPTGTRTCSRPRPATTWLPVSGARS